MEIDKESLEEFKKIYKEEFGEELTDAEAREMAQRVLRLYELLAGIPPEGGESAEPPSSPEPLR